MAGLAGFCYGLLFQVVRYGILWSPEEPQVLKGLDQPMYPGLLVANPPLREVILDSLLTQLHLSMSRKQ